MYRYILTTRRAVDYSILLRPRADGPIVGTYGGRPIPAAVIDEFGRRYTYAGLAPRLSSGRYDVAALHRGEWIVEPGLVYRGEEIAQKGPRPFGLFAALGPGAP
jgi:hypothetical protein